MNSSLPVNSVLRHCCAVMLVCLAGAASGQAQGIYSCVDAKGRRLTSDRPIPDCIDREQKVLNPNGSVRATLGPTLSANERAEQDAREKKELEVQARLVEEKRRDRALLIRYPGKAAHEQERAQALAQIDVAKQGAAKQAEKLQREHSAVLTEMEFYKKDPGKTPAPIRRKFDEVTNNLAIQAHFMADQDDQIRRINRRFDEEQVRLNKLWATPSAPAVAASKKP